MSLLFGIICISSILAGLLANSPTVITAVERTKVTLSCPASNGGMYWNYYDWNDNYKGMIVVYNIYGIHLSSAGNREKWGYVKVHKVEDGKTKITFTAKKFLNGLKIQCIVNDGRSSKGEFCIHVYDNKAQIPTGQQRSKLSCRPVTKPPTTSTSTTTVKPTTQEITTPPTTTPLSTTPLLTTPLSTTPLSTTPLPTTPLSTTPLSTTPLPTTPLSTTPLSTTPLSTTPNITQIPTTTRTELNTMSSSTLNSTNYTSTTSAPTAFEAGETTISLNKFNEGSEILTANKQKSEKKLELTIGMTVFGVVVFVCLVLMTAILINRRHKLRFEEMYQHFKHSFESPIYNSDDITDLAINDARGQNMKPRDNVDSMYDTVEDNDNLPDVVFHNTIYEILID